MYIQPELFGIIDKLAEEHNISIALVKKIISSQFEYVEQEMKKGEKGKPETFKAVRLSHLGTFYPSVKYIKRFVKLQKDKEECQE